jgi:excisionase family DNA binding protein
MSEPENSGVVGRFLTLADTAEILNISASHAYGLLRSGELPAIKIGSQWRVERAVLETYIEAMYEEARRASLWNQADYANVSELSFGRRGTTYSRTSST